jgi:oligopeptide transport system ATP-binding protein
VLFDGRDILQLPEQQLRRLRGGEIAMVFQNPMTTLNPTLTVGRQLQEVIRLHTALPKEAARQRAVELLALVEIPDPAARMHSYPHQLSGGLRQRVMIALALSGEPKLLIADEATTALDVTTQAQILHLLKKITADSRTAMLVVTHNMGVVAGIADRVAVMYAGRIVETGDVQEIFYRPRHPYTVGLLGSIPRLDSPRSQDLMAIEGRPPTLLSKSSGCPFMDRCWLAMEVCASKDPQERMSGAANAHLAACWGDAAVVRKPMAGAAGQLAATNLKARSETNE